MALSVPLWNPDRKMATKRQDHNYWIVSGAPFSTQRNGNEIDTVSRIMDRVALQVADQIKKDAPTPMKE